MKAKLSCPMHLLRAIHWQLLCLVIVASLVSAIALGCKETTPAAGTSPAQVAEATATTAPTAPPVPTAKATATTTPAKPSVPTAAPTPAAPTTDQLMAETIRATNTAKTVKFNSTTGLILNATGGQQPITVSMTGDGTGTANMANKEMQINMNMNVDIAGQGKQQITVQMYMVGGYVYIKMAIPGVGDQWMKMKLTDQMWQDEIQIDQQLALLKSATRLRVVGTEDVGGIQTYVVDITPDMQAMFKLLGQAQVPGMEELDLSKLDAFAGLFRDTTVKYWISKDKFLLTKVQMRMAGEIPSSAFGATPADSGNMTIDLNVMANYTYDQPVSITLPQEAQGATEVPSTPNR